MTDWNFIFFNVLVVLGDIEDEVSYEVKSLKQASAAFVPENVEDLGILPGDRRGGAGLDSSLFR